MAAALPMRSQAWSRAMTLPPRIRIGLASCAMGLAAACASGRQASNPAGDVVAADGADQDIGTPADAYQSELTLADSDTGALGDAWTGMEVSGEIVSDTTSDLGSDTAAPPPTATCPGDPGCACLESSKCSSGLCTVTASGKKCAKICKADECASDEVCTEVPKLGASFCVAKWPFLCNPCHSNSECQPPLSPMGSCIDKEPGGAYCGTDCTTKADCPLGYVCEPVQPVSGGEVKQCVPAKGGVCTCSKYAIETEASAFCFIQGAAGVCKGSIACLPAGAAGAPAGGGLSTCLGATPTAETCDGEDNDCDGFIDEDACDDGNACTKDSCDGLSCKNVAYPNGFQCASGKTCQSGACK